jgi:hypothetical protein
MVRVKLFLVLGYFISLAPSPLRRSFDLRQVKMSIFNSFKRGQHVINKYNFDQKMAPYKK